MSGAVAYGGSVAALSSAQEGEKKAVNTTYSRFTFGSEKPVLSPSEACKDRAATEQKIRASAEKILRAFNTWSFKREQPSDAALMLKVIADAVAARRGVPFVLYWGKGPRHRACSFETQCLDFLAALASRIAAVYPPGASIRLILTDTHAEHNGHSREDIRRYFDDVKAAASQHGFETCWLGQLVKAAGILATAAPLEEAVPREMLRSLVASARKWYRGPGSAEDGALTYLRMNLIEQRVVERAFPQAIFVTFNGSELRPLFPRQLPIFYMYSLRRGVSVKPWFLPSEAEKLEPSADQTATFHPGAG